jgi:transcriptional regulator with XRE-family HTH domain
MTFKEKLVILRKSKNLTQDEFASAVGVTRQAVYKWESGQSYPEVPKLLEMKQLFSISIDELLDDNHDIPLPEKKKRKRTPKAAAPKVAPVPKAEPVVAAAPTPKAEPVVKATPIAQPAPAPKAEPVVAAAPAPKAEPVVKASPVAQPAVKAAPIAQPAPAPAPKAEPVAKPEPKIDSVPGPTEIEINDLKEADESTKKTSFFDRLFGRK